MIPLPGDCMSIGAVCYPEYLRERRGSNAEFLLATLQRIPGARERMQGRAHSSAICTPPAITPIPAAA